MLLCCVLLVGLLPTAALATQTQAEVIVNGGDPQPYSNLSDAFAAVKDCTAEDNAIVKIAGTLQLASERTISSGVFTLDLNGKYVKNKPIIMTGGTVTLVDNGENAGNERTIQEFKLNGGTLNIQSGSIEELYVNDSATLNISGGEIAGSLVVGNPAGKISLSGGSFDSIRIDTTTEGKRDLADLLADGYAFQLDDQLQFLQSLTGQSTIDNVTVVKCTHPYISIGECPYCGSTVEMEEIKSITAVGNGSGNWLNGANWEPDNASNHMKETTVGSGVYEITYTGVAADKYMVKFVANDEWTPAWGAEYDAENVPLKGDATYSGDPIPYSVAEDNSTVKLVLDLSGLDRATGAGVRYTITITPPSAAEASPVYVGGEQLLLNTKYVNDSSGSVTVSTDDTCNAIVTGNETDGYTLTISELNVTGKTDNTSTKYKSAAIYTETDKPLTIVVEKDSTVTGAQTDAHSAGVYAKNALTITGSGTLTANGGKATGGGSGSYGVMCNGALTIENTLLNATGGDAGESSVGVFGSSVTINGDNTLVTAVGGEGSWRSCGMGSSSSSIRLNGGKVIASGNNNAIITPFDTNSQNGKEVKYLVKNETLTNFNDPKVTNAKKLTVTLGEPAPKYHTVRFYTNGGVLSGEGVTTVTANSQYTMQYQEGVGMTLPTPIRDGYTFGGWYDKSDFAASSGPVGSIGAGSGMNFTYYAKWEVPAFSEAVITLGTQGIYNGTEQSVCITSVTLGGKALTKDVDYEIISGGTATNVKNTTLTIQGKGAYASYTGVKTIDWSLQKATPNLKADFAQNVIDTLTNGVVYTGSHIRIPTTLKEGKTGMGRVDTYYKASDSQPALSAAKDAGDYIVFFDIKEGTNYKATTLTVGTLTVRKADYSGNKNLTASVRYDKANTDVAVQLPALPDGAAYGTAVYCEAYSADNNKYGTALLTTDMSPVNGTTLYFSTYSVTTPGVYADIEIPITGAKNYNDYAIVVRVTCVDRTTVEFSGIADNQSFVYNGTGKTPAGTLAVSNDVDVETLEVKYEKIADEVSTEITGVPKDVGSYRVTYSVPDSNDLYKGSATYSFTITPKSITVSGITAVDKTYDGTTSATLNCSHAVLSGKETGDDLTVTAAGAFEYADAGETKTVNISDLTLDGTDMGNYVLAENNQQTTATASINKGSAPNPENDASLTISNNYAHTYEYDFSTLLPTLESGKSYGSVTYGTPNASLGDYYENGAVIDANGRLTLPIVAKETDQTGSVGTVMVTVSSTNYEDFTLTLNVNAANMKIPAGAPTLSKNELTYGEALSTITLSGSMKDGETDVPGKFVWNAPATKPNAGAYAASWTFTPDDQLHYAVVSGSSTITVNKAAQSAPNAPELESRTSSSITLKTIADANGAKVQYRINGGEWQDSPAFTGLRSSTEYTFEARYAATGNYEASDAGTAAKFSTRTDGWIGYTYYTLTFETNGGSTIASERFCSGTTVDLAKYTPTYKGYTFTGWYSDKKLTDKITKITMNSSKTVYAGWQKQAAETPFTDVSKSDWFYDDVMYVYEKGLMNGTGGTAFSPYLSTTRGMIVTILYRMEGSPTVTESCLFADVKSGSYYEKAVTWAAANGIVNGYSSEQFGPNDNITREQLAAIFYRYAGYKEMEAVTLAEHLTGFADSDKISTYAISAMNWAVGEGLMQGSGNYLSPQGDATRAQVAAILHRFLTK